MAAIIGALRAVLSLDSAAFERGLTQAQKGLRDFDKRAKAIGQGVAAVGAAVSVVGAGIALAIRGQLDRADAMGETAEKLGIGVKALSELDYAAKITGVSAEGLETSIRVLSRTMVAAVNGNKGAADLFASVGVAVTDATGAVRPANEVMADLADVFAKMPNGAEKTALAIQLFGKSGADMLLMLNGGSAQLRDLAAEAAKFGLVLSDETVQAAGKFNESLDRLRLIGEGLATQVMAALVPVMQSLADKALMASQWFASLSPEVQSVAAAVAGFTVILGPLLLGLGAVVASLGVVGSAIAGMTAVLLANPIILVIAGIAAGAALIYANWDSVSAWFAGLWERVKEGAAAGWEGIKYVFLNYTAPGLIYTHWDTLVGWFDTLWAGVKAGASLGWQAIRAVLWDYQPAVLVYQNWDGLTAYFGRLLASLPAVFTAGWEQVKAVVRQWPTDFYNFGADIVAGLINGIKENWTGLTDWFGTATDSLTSAFTTPLEIRSPSRVFMGYGRNITEGLQMGLESGTASVGAAMGGVTDAVAGAGDSIQSALSGLEQEARGIFKGLATGTLTWAGALDRVKAKLTDLLLDSAFNTLFGSLFGKLFGGGASGSFGLFANGAAFSGGRVMAFANGGVIDRATAFGMRDGLGVMGEAGPEAIMPLTRGPGGQLGVQAIGGGGVDVRVVVESSEDLRVVARTEGRSGGAEAAAGYAAQAQQRQRRG